MAAMARLQLARALALSGNTVKAKRAYADLLTLWKDADPDIPILRNTKAEHDRLRCSGGNLWLPIPYACWGAPSQ
jgi:hypothetical protein